MEHTPGPWELARGRYTTAIVKEGQGNKKERFGDRLIAFTYNKRHEANANLFLAAPDLLRECESALRYIEHGQYENWGEEAYIQGLKAAIAKAKATR